MGAALETPCAVQRLSLGDIESRLAACPCLPSLASITSRLRELLEMDNLDTARIAELIRRDPSLSEAVLHVVNSVFYGLRQKVRSVEEAVSYLGMQQIRQLILIAPVMEEFQKLLGNENYPWRGFWQHSLATALITHELVECLEKREDDLSYLAGLLHDIGKIVMASAFPVHFRVIQHRVQRTGGGLASAEIDVLGLDHGRLGALYLRNHKLVGEIVGAAEFHHHPDRAPYQSNIIAGVQIADLLICHRGIGSLGEPSETGSSWRDAIGWTLLYTSKQIAEKSAAQAAIAASSEKLKAKMQQLL
jgi:putative nucleotidyltransferase with HDIG domain